MLLSAYSYDIKFRRTEAHGNADCLSRLPLPEVTPEGQSVEATICNLTQIEKVPITSVQIRQAILKNAVLSKVLEFTQRGWPKQVDEALIPRSQQLSVEDGCLLLGPRVIKPSQLKDQVLTELHETHPGIVRMKAIARSHVWWPQIDSNIEDMVKSCPSCLSVKQSPSSAPLHPWTWPSKPWLRIHVDFLGPFLYSKMFIVLVDAHSEVYEMPNTTAQKTVDVLRHVFATFGLPQQLVPDNGPKFVASEFSEFLKANGVKHIRCNPYHPASNRLAERFVRSFKQAMKPVELQLDLFSNSLKISYCVIAPLHMLQQDVLQHHCS